MRFLSVWSFVASIRLPSGDRDIGKPFWEVLDGSMRKKTGMRVWNEYKQKGGRLSWKKETDSEVQTRVTRMGIETSRGENDCYNDGLIKVDKRSCVVGIEDTDVLRFTGSVVDDRLSCNMQKKHSKTIIHTYNISAK